MIGDKRDLKAANERLAASVHRLDRQVVDLTHDLRDTTTERDVYKAAVAELAKQRGVTDEMVERAARVIDAADGGFGHPGQYTRDLARAALSAAFQDKHEPQEGS